MHADMKQMLIKPVSYIATAAFDEHCSDDDIYKHIAEPLVIGTANGGVNTLLMYGQTGCGKVSDFHFFSLLYHCIGP